MIQKECRRAAFAKEAASLLKNFGAVEKILDADKQLDFGSSTKGKSSSGSGSGYNDGNDISEEELNHMASLERVGHTTLHLMQQLQSSSEQITAALTVGNVNVNVNGNGNPAAHAGKDNINFNTPLPGDTERAQFIMKLAPRIRALEKTCAQILARHLERVLKRRMNLYQHSKDEKNANGSQGAPVVIHVKSAYPNSNELLALGHLFRSFTLLNRASDAESIFARVAIMPLVRNKVSIGRLDEGGSRGECAGLKSLLEDIKVEICGAWGDVLVSMEGNFDMYVPTIDGQDANGDIEGIPPQVDLITAGVWVPILTALLTDPAIRMAIFSPGIASIFQQNYSILDRFVSNLAGNLLDPSSSSSSSSSSPSSSSDNALVSASHDASTTPNPTHLDADQTALMELYYRPQMDSRIVQSAQSRIYAHPMTSEYSKKWNLPIYYQLRFGQICSRIEEAIHKIQYSNEGWHRKDNVTTFEDAADANHIRRNHGFELAFFQELVDSMSWFWRDDVYLKPLTHRFLRGTIQILGRIISFIKEGLEGEVKFGLIEAGQGGDDDEEEDGLKENGLPSISPSASASTYEYTWCDRIEDVAAVSWELTQLEKYIAQHHIPTIVDILCSNQSQSQSPSPEQEESDQTSTEGTVALVKEIMSDVSNEIKPVVNKIWDEIIVNIMISQCSTPLAAVKGIAATYRMTNRPPPTQPSPFVNTILRPLHDFDTSVSDRTPPYLGTSWKKKIVDHVSERYSKAVSELIETVKRTEEALKNRKTRRALSGGMSDGEKVRLQLYLDQKAFVVAVEGIGVDPQTVHGVGKLIELTKDGAKQPST